jgi:hypothetical protein
VGLLDWLGLRSAVALGSTPSAHRGVVSPWAGPSNLHKIVVDDIFGQDTTTVTRAQAMAVPAIAKARHMVCVTLARQPLLAYRAGEVDENGDPVPMAEQPAWLRRTDEPGAPSPFHRLLWTIDDLMFHGWSLWAVKRGSEGQVLDAMRVPIDQWTFESDGRVVVETLPDRYPKDGEVILIPGIGEGMLAEAARTVRGAWTLEDRWQARAKNPVPVVELRYTGDEDLEPEEMRTIRQSYVDASQDENGVVMVTPKGFELHAHGDQALDLLVAGRNAAALDAARYANLPATAADASATNGSSVTYQNVMAGRAEFTDITLRGWAAPIEARLSMDDVVPRGQYLAFDFSSLTRTPDPGVGPARED